ncbi:MAG TPA: LysR substrate-binding domain-containing protein [Stenomitos sp.]
MELRHLRYFVAVAEELHFGRAAQRLQMAQPPLSQQIRALEGELGVELFERTRRSVRLTSAGKAFLAETYRTLAQADHAVDVARRVSRGEMGRLKVGFVSSAAYNVVPDLIRLFRSQYPDILLELRELTGDMQLENLRSGQIDLGFYRLDPGYAQQLREGTFQVETVLREPFLIALPEQHPLAMQPELTLAMLEGEPFVLFPRHQSPSFYDLIVRLCQEAGFSPTIVQEAMLMQTIVSLVAAGIGVALVPASLEHLRRTGIVYRRLVEPQAFAELSAIWRADDASPVLERFLAVMRTSARIVAD